MGSQKNSPGDILEVRGKKCHKNPVYFLNCSEVSINTWTLYLRKIF